VSFAEKLLQLFLPLFESACDLAAHEYRIRDAPQKAKAYLVVDHVADERPVNAATSFRNKFVAMMPALERTFILHVGEMVIPLKLGDAGDPLGAHRQKRKDAERCDES